jgi:hypothetical protein
MSTQDQNSTKVVLTLTPTDLCRIEEIANTAGVNRTDAARLAIATQDFVSRSRKEGSTFLAQDSFGEMREIEFAP